jgi:hypothetical protein
MGFFQNAGDQRLDFRYNRNWTVRFWEGENDAIHETD